MHNRRSCATHAVVLALLLTQLACATLLGSGPAGPPTPDAPDTPASGPSPRDLATPRPTAIPLEQVEGIACMGTSGRGVFCIEDGTWRSMTRQSSSLNNDYIVDIAVCPDQRLAILHLQGIDIYDGQRWIAYPKGWGPASGTAIACDLTADGAGSGIWVTHFRGVSYFRDAEWTTFPAHGTLGHASDASDLVYDVAITHLGEVWVITADGAALMNGALWRTYEEGKGFDRGYSLRAVTLDPSGLPWIAAGSGVLQFDEWGWREHAYVNSVTPSSIAMDSLGRVWVGTNHYGLMALEKGGWLRYTWEDGTLPSNSIHTLWIDAADRVWVGTSWGLSVLDGETWQTFRMENADIPDNEVRAIAVVGAGPRLPEPQEKAAGTLTGRFLLEDGQPLANAPVEICVERTLISLQGETLCGRQPYVRRTMTLEDGVFIIESLPPGLYAVTVLAEEGWSKVADQFGLGPERIEVRPGEVTDLGALTRSERN